MNDGLPRVQFYKGMQPGVGRIYGSLKFSWKEFERWVAEAISTMACNRKWKEYASPDSFVRRRLNDGLPGPVLQRLAAKSGKDTCQLII